MFKFLSRASVTIGFTLFVLFNLSAQTTTNTRIAVINSASFQDANNGVTKLLDIAKRLDTEFKTKKDEITSMQKRIETLAREVQSSSSYNQKKAEEHEKLSRDIKYKVESYQAQFQKRYTELIDPVHIQMGTALNDWCKKNGYSMMVDISKDEKGMFLWVEDSLVNQTTADLIKHFNTVLK